MGDFTTPHISGDAGPRSNDLTALGLWQGWHSMTRTPRVKTPTSQVRKQEGKGERPSVLAHTYPQHWMKLSQEDQKLRESLGWI